MLAAVLLMIVSGVLMVAIVAFLLIINTRIERQQRERYFGDISHVDGDAPHPSAIFVHIRLRPPQAPSVRGVAHDQQDDEGDAAADERLDRAVDE
ncbi:MAG: hypothetical protein DI618_03330 [Dermacoccus nishinomiyaensis]|nr:MAG: hypothetical protein DI618_03330 [Dermacoccus nishinomiyaensis]